MFVTLPFPDWCNVVSFLMSFALNLLFQNFETSGRQLKFDKSLSVSKIFGGNPDWVRVCLVEWSLHHFWKSHVVFHTDILYIQQHLSTDV